MDLRLCILLLSASICGVVSKRHHRQMNGQLESQYMDKGKRIAPAAILPFAMLAFEAGLHIYDTIKNSKRKLHLPNMIKTRKRKLHLPVANYQAYGDMENYYYIPKNLARRYRHREKIFAYPAI